ncbi:hypothetical protein GG344DRAFT_81385 [Lentinula edodes]|nr:hypothetical protein GG344DRAFT_81385 [Lentinula edodes]
MQFLPRLKMYPVSKRTSLTNLQYYDLCPSAAIDQSRFAWNIHGRFILKLRNPAFLKYITTFDIIVVEETWLRPGQEDSLPLPEGYDIISSPRPDCHALKRAGGSVAVIFRSSLAIEVRSDLCAPDVVVVETADYRIIGGYLLPSGSYYGDWSEVDPKESIASIITQCASSPKPVLVFADLNGRIGDRVSCVDSPPRFSSDTISNARGTWILQLCSDNGLHVLNGTSFESTQPGQLTSYQPMGASVNELALFLCERERKESNGHSNQPI